MEIEQIRKFHYDIFFDNWICKNKNWFKFLLKQHELEKTLKETMSRLWLSSKQNIITICSYLEFNKSSNNSLKGNYICFQFKNLFEIQTSFIFETFYDIMICWKEGKRCKTKVYVTIGYSNFRFWSFIVRHFTLKANHSNHSLTMK